MALLDMIKDYQELLEKKDSLANQTKANNAAIEAAKKKIAEQMVDDDCTGISYGGYRFSLQDKTAYTKRSDEELDEAGIDFFKTLRAEGLGVLIVEKVDPRTLQSAMRAYVEEHEELSDGLQSIIRSYDYNDIGRTKEKAKASAKAKKGAKK